jgi:hypothetical protein
VCDAFEKRTLDQIFRAKPSLSSSKSSKALHMAHDQLNQWHQQNTSKGRYTASYQGRARALPYLNAVFHCLFNLSFVIIRLIAAPRGPSKDSTLHHFDLT